MPDLRKKQKTVFWHLQVNNIVLFSSCHHLLFSAAKRYQNVNLGDWFSFLGWRPCVFLRSQVLLLKCSRFLCHADLICLLHSVTAKQASARECSQGRTWRAAWGLQSCLLPSSFLLFLCPSLILWLQMFSSHPDCAGLQLVTFFVDWLFFLSRNTCALLSLQLCHFLLTQTKWREANTSLKILSVIWYDTVWEMLKPFQSSKRADCGGVKESFPARAAGCTAPVTAPQGWCAQPRSAPAAGCSSRDLQSSAGCRLSGRGTRRAHHAIACPACPPDNPYPIQAISAQLACSILYIWNTNMGQTVNSSTVSLPKLGSEHQCQCVGPADLSAVRLIYISWESGVLGNTEALASELRNGYMEIWTCRVCGFSEHKAPPGCNRNCECSGLLKNRPCIWLNTSSYTGVCPALWETTLSFGMAEDRQNI